MIAELSKIYEAPKFHGNQHTSSKDKLSPDQNVLEKTSKATGVGETTVKREDFNPMELSDGLSRRKELYEFEHPETKVGQFGQKGGKIVEKTDSDISRFTQETAKTIGKSETLARFIFDFCLKIQWQIFVIDAGKLL